MKKSIVCLFFCVVLLNAEMYSKEITGIENKPVNFGFTFWGNSFSSADDIIGGYYLATGIDIITNKILLSSSYNTNIMPNIFQNRLIETSLNYRIVEYRNEYCSAIGISHLINLNDNNNYFGISIIPFSTWRSAFTKDVGVSLQFFPVKILYGVSSEKLLWSFEFLRINVFF